MASQGCLWGFGEMGELAGFPVLYSYYAWGLCRRTLGLEIPSREEALSLYDESYVNKDWEGETIHLHPMFAGKCGRQIWTSEENEEGQVLVVNLQDGSADFVDKETRDNQSARLVRDPNPPSPAPLD